MPRRQRRCGAGGRRTVLDPSTSAATVKTCKDVEERLVELRAKAESGVPLTPTRLTLGTYLEEWLTQIVAHRVRPNTLGRIPVPRGTSPRPRSGGSQAWEDHGREVRVYRGAGHRDRQEQERVQLAERWPASGHVFTTPIGTPIDPDNCSKAVQAALERAGVRPVRMHDFRHGCVSVLLALGVPPRTVMEIAGHSALEMTMNVYAHVTLGRQAGGAGPARRPVRGGREMTALLSPVAVSQPRAALGRRRRTALETQNRRSAGWLPAVRVLRACRDSNPKPSDP